jgi:hypothetical protein
MQAWPITFEERNPSSQFDIVIVYEDFTAAKRAQRTCDLLDFFEQTVAATEEDPHVASVKLREDREPWRFPLFACSVVAVARRVRRVNSYVVPALFRRARRVTLGVAR